MALVGNVASQHLNFPLLYGPRASNERQKARLANAIGTDQANHAACRDIKRDTMKGNSRPIGQPYTFGTDDKAAVSNVSLYRSRTHFTVSARFFGHSAFASSLT